MFSLAWKRFTTIVAVTSDAQARVIAVLFYFTIFVPFGLGSTIFSDPLRRKHPKPEWLEREPVPDDMNSAKQQG